MAGRRKEGSDPVLRPASDKLDPSGFIVKHWLGSIDERCSDGPVIAGKTLTSATESGGSSARDSLLPLPTELESTFPRPHRVPIFLLLSLDSSFHAPTLSDNDRYKSTALILSHRVDRVSLKLAKPCFDDSTSSVRISPCEISPCLFFLRITRYGGTPAMIRGCKSSSNRALGRLRRVK